MSSIVAWLAARSLPGTGVVADDDSAPVPRVRPRLPGRYETDATSSPPFAEDVAHDAAPAAAAPVPRPEAPAPAPEQRRGEPERQPQRPVIVPSGAAAAPPARGQPAPRVHAAQDAERPAAKAAPPAADLQTGKTQNGSAPPTASAPEAAPASRPRLPDPVRQEAAQHHAAPPRDSVREERRATHAKSRDATPRKTPRPAPAVVVAPVQRAPAGRAAPLMPPHADRPRALVPNVSATAAAPPRVQVTIERLEIRTATAQPPPQRRPPPRPSTMSLDAYLADRGGRG